jgi:hypothetical protein
VDDLLPDDAWWALLSWANTAEYHFVHETSLNRGWRLTDGNPLQGPTHWSEGDAPAPLRRLSEAVQAVAERETDLLGAPGRNWSRFSLSPWIYPRRSGLSAHQDADIFAGAFIFYMHRVWDVHWGGLLLAFASGRKPPGHRLDGSPQTWPPVADVEPDGDNLMSQQIVACVPPRPNRLVLIGPDTPHLITPVGDAAGDRSRLSVAGFFQRIQSD